MLEQALFAGDRTTTERVLNNLDADGTLADALRTKHALWRQRGEVIANAIETRSPADRIIPPLARDDWDVVGASKTPSSFTPA